MTGHLPRRALHAGGWRVARRVALRELARAKGRTALVALMVLLPVMAVVTLDVLARTSDVDPVEGLPRALGTASAELTLQGGSVLQSPRADRIDFRSAGLPPTPPRLRAALPADARLLPVATAEGVVGTTDDRTTPVVLHGVDLGTVSDRGPYAVVRGRAAARPDEVAVSPSLARFGTDVGDVLLLPGGERRSVVGVVTGPGSPGERRVHGLPAALGLSDDPSRYYVSGPPVTWEQVRALNRLGVLVLSRQVVLDPPPASQVPEIPGYDDGGLLALLGLLTVVAVLEVVLLAGPAFAVGARRQRRSLGLLSASGGEPRHVRRVLLTQGVLVGAGAAVLAVPLGIGLAALLWLGLRDSSWGPFEVPWRDVALVLVLGAGTAVLAALTPAVLAGREDVVDALRGGRRAGGGLPVRLSALGGALVLLGTWACWASLRAGSPELLVGFSALPTVLGAVALAPLLLHLVGRAAGRLPLALRLAVRDADRQRRRTGPAVAAVAAAVAGAVALGLAASTDAAEAGASYAPAGPPGAAVLSGLHPDADLPRLRAAVQELLPGRTVTTLRGLAPEAATTPVRSTSLLVCLPGAPAAVSCPGPQSGYSDVFGSPWVVGTEALEVLAPLLDPDLLPAARQALAAGSALVAGVEQETELDLRWQRSAVEADGVERAVLLGRARVPVHALPVRQEFSPVTVVLPAGVAARLGPVRPVALVVDAPVGPALERELRSAVGRLDGRVLVSVERGPSDELQLVLLLLVAGASVVVLGGTLAATSLVLSEARADLGTLGAVGAAPGLRRRVAAGTAGGLALLGALLGTAAGLVPGVAGAVAITRFGVQRAVAPETVTSLDRLRYLDVPWLLLLGVLVLLPLVAAAVAAVSTRSALPGQARRREA